LNGEVVAWSTTIEWYEHFRRGRPRHRKIWV